MIWFIIKRLIRSAFTVFFVSFVIFFLIRVIPGDPVRQIVSGIASDAAVERVRKELGLDKPITTQFMIFMQNALRGDLGESFFRSAEGHLSGSITGSSDVLLRAAEQDKSGLDIVEGERAKKASVTKLIFERFPLTIKIILTALFSGIACSYLLAQIGVRYQKFGSAVEVFTVFLAAIPNFWLAIMFILIFAVKFKLLPGVGYSGAISLILPASVLALTLIPAAFKTIYENLKRINREPFMVEMEARGIPERTISMHRHKHLFSSIITFLGLQWGSLFGVVIIIEYLYSIPGMGTLFIYAVLQRDYPIIVGGVLILALLFVTLNFVVDVLYGVLDSRVREW